MFIKPRAGFRVLDPTTLIPLPAEGREVNSLDTYWHRRLADLDVELAEAPLELTATAEVKTVATSDKE